MHMQSWWELGSSVTPTLSGVPSQSLQLHYLWVEVSSCFDFGPLQGWRRQTLLGRGIRFVPTLWLCSFVTNVSIRLCATPCQSWHMLYGQSPAPASYYFIVKVSAYFMSSLIYKSAHVPTLPLHGWDWHKFNFILLHHWISHVPTSSFDKFQPKATLGLTSTTL